MKDRKRLVKPKRKKIKYAGTSYYITVLTYTSNSMRLKIENDKESRDITVDIPDSFISNDMALLDPVVLNNGLFKTLKKARIIRWLTDYTELNSVPIPIVKININILKLYDYNGVYNHLNKIQEKEGF